MTRRIRSWWHDPGELGAALVRLAWCYNAVLAVGIAMLVLRPTPALW